MEFITSLVNSIGNLSWLKSQRANMARAWRYYLLFCLLFAVISIIPVVVVFPSVLRKTFQAVDKLPTFEINIKQGKLSTTGLPQRFMFNYPEASVAVIVDVGTTTLPLEQYSKEINNSGAVLLLSSEKLTIFDKESGTTREKFLKDLPNFTITRETIKNALQQITKWPWLLAGFIITVVVTYFGVVFSKLLIIIVSVTLVLLLSNIAGRKWRWRELFSVGLFAVTLPSLIEFVMGFVRSNFSNLFFIAFLAFLLAVVFTKDETEQLQKLNKTV